MFSKLIRRCREGFMRCFMDEKYVLEEKEKMKEALSKWLNRYLAATGLMEKEAARKAGIKETTFNSWIRKASFPDQGNLIRLSRLLSVPCYYLSLDPDRIDRAGIVPDAAYVGGELHRYIEIGQKLQKEGTLEDANRILEQYLLSVSRLKEKEKG